MTLERELTLPDSVEIAAAMLNDPAEINRWLQARRFTDLQDRYNQLSAPSLPRQIADILDAREAQNGTVAVATRAAMDDWMREHGASANISRPNVGGAGNDAHPVMARSAAAGQIQEVGFTNLGDFAREMWHRNPNPSTVRRTQVREIMNAFSSTEGSAGGDLIPEFLDTEIRALTLEQSIVRRLATPVPMGGPTQLFPFVDWQTNVGSTFGGWTVTRVPEGGTITPSSAKFGRVRLAVSKQVAGAEIPNEMFADVAALDGFIRATLPQAMAFAEDIDFLTGDGVGGPLGMLHASNTALITVTKETDQIASTVMAENILKMYARMIPSSKTRAVWLVNPTDMPQLMTLSIAVGTGGAPVALVDIRSGPLITMLTRPIIETEKVPALGAAGDIAFVDPMYYLIGERPGSALESSPHAQFMNDITEMKLTARNDGRPWIAAPFQPTNGDTLSPFVVLGARA